MRLVGRQGKSVIAGLFAAGAAIAFASCASPESPTETPDDANVTQEAPAAEAVEIPDDTPVGEESQRIVELLNAEDDTTADDWEDRLHPSFTAEVPVEDLVDLFNQNLRPAQPFTATGYEGGDRQAVTTLESPVSEPMDMQVALDTEGLITGLFFGESNAAG